MKPIDIDPSMSDRVALHRIALRGLRERAGFAGRSIWKWMP